MRRKVRMIGDAHMGGRQLKKGDTVAGYEHDLQALVHAGAAEWTDVPAKPEAKAPPTAPQKKKAPARKSAPVKPEADDGA